MASMEETVRAWDRRMQAAPTFEEVRDVEFIRRSGEINMLTENLQRVLYDRGRYAGVMWLERCKESRVPWYTFWEEAMATFQKIHGSADTWFTSDLLDEWEEAEISNEEEQLQRRLAELKSRRRAKSPTKRVR